nr:fluoride efflux transporter CrcB [Actinokineospora sp. NBRC 105648]
MGALLVAAGAALGAPLRYLTDRAVQRGRDRFPWGTLTVNVVGSLILGVVVAVGDDQWRLLLGTGLCGALTTYSTFSYETLHLAETGRGRQAVVNVVVSVACGLAAFTVGLLVARSLFG